MTKDLPTRQKVYICKADRGDRDHVRHAHLHHARASRLPRRPVMPADVQTPMTFYKKKGRAQGTFDEGVCSGLERLLASPRSEERRVGKEC